MKTPKLTDLDLDRLGRPIITGVTHRQRWAWTRAAHPAKLNAWLRDLADQAARRAGYDPGPGPKLGRPPTR